MRGISLDGPLFTPERPKRSRAPRRRKPELTPQPQSPTPWLDATRLNDDGTSMTMTVRSTSNISVPVVSGSVSAPGYNYGYSMAISQKDLRWS